MLATDEDLVADEERRQHENAPPAHRLPVRRQFRREVDVSESRRARVREHLRDRIAILGCPNVPPRIRA